MVKETHKATVVRIKLTPHPNADRLSIIPLFDGTVNVVGNTADWEGKELAVYIPPQNMVDTRRDEFKFLARDGKTHIEIKPVKLRGVVSYGLLIPAPNGVNEGDDLTEVLGISHVDHEAKFNTGDFVSGPSISKYDIDSGVKLHKDFNKDDLCVCTEKIHGCLKHDSKVQTPTGLISIEDIDVGYDIISYNTETKQFEFDKVLQKWVSEDSAEWLTIELEDGRYITCTTNHLILTKDGYKEAGSLTEKDDILTF